MSMVRLKGFIEAIIASQQSVESFRFLLLVVSSPNRSFLAVSVVLMVREIPVAAHEGENLVR